MPRNITIKPIIILLILLPVFTGISRAQNYCSSYGNTSYQTSITLVNFNTISNSSAKPSGYSDYTSITTEVTKGISYNLTVNLNTDGNYRVWARVWIDWNGNGSFNDSGESYDLGNARNTTNGPTSLSPLAINVPAGAVTGTTRMRVSAKYNSYPAPCETNFDGEVEDYTLNVAPPSISFYSQGSDPAQLSNWNTVRTGGGSSPASFTASNQTFVIQATHSMTAATAWSVSGTGTKVQIESAASLTANAAVSLSSSTTFQIDNGGVYNQNHNINNNIFSGTSSFAAGSTVNYMLSGAQTVASVVYGNLTLSGSGAKTLTGATVNGVLSMEGTVTASGTAPSFGSAASLQYKGSSAQATGIEFPASFAGTGGVIVNNAAGVTLSGSKTIGSQLTLTGGALSIGSYTLTLSNGSVLSYGAGSLTGGTSSDLTIGTGADITLSAVSGGLNNLSTSRNITLGASLDVGGTLTLTAGNFTVGANTLTLNGPAIAGTPTNLITSSASSLSFGGTSAGVNIPGSVTSLNNLTIANPAGITLSGNVTVGNILTMTQGNIDAGSYVLALSGSAEGALSHISGTVIGSFRRAISTTPGINYLFPVGTASCYRPARLVFSSLSSTVNITARFVESSPDGFVPYSDGGEMLNNAFTEGYWRFYSSAPGTTNYSVILTGDSFVSFPLDDFARITGRDNGNSTWRALGSHGTVSGNDVSRTGVTNLNTTSFDFALATCYTPVFLGYKYERNITIDHNRVAGGEDLYNFPVMISLSGENFLKTSPDGQVSDANGYDIIFSDTSYNELDHQVEYYNGTNGDLIAWVRIPVLSASENTVIKIIYGNPQITTDPSVTTVWDSHYRGVWHLNDNNLKDYTAYNKSGTPYNNPAYPSGMISNSLGMNGSNQYVQVNNASNLNFAGNITVSAWVYMNAGNRDQKIAGNQNNSSGGYKFGIYTNNKVEFEIRNSANTASLNRDVPGGTVLSTGQWYYLAGISSDVLDSIKTFVNGVSERPFKKTGTLGVASDNMVVGREPFSSLYYFNGRFDELRISDKVRSDGWLRTEYYNQSSPSTFYTIDATGTEPTNLPSAGYCNGPITLDFGYPAGGTYSGNPYISGNIFSPPDPGTYTIIYDYVGGCGPTSISKDIVVTGSPDPPEAEDKEYCYTQIAYLEATSGENIRWYYGGSLVSTANPFSTGQTSPGVYNYTVTQTVNGCESDPTPVTLSIYNGATISSHPADADICEGDNAVFTVSAAGVNLSYRWQENGINLSDGGIYSGTATSTLTLAAPALALSGRNYRCVITTSCGSSATSNTGQLTVNPLPVATFSYAGTPYCPNAANPMPTFSGGGIAGAFSAEPEGLVFVSTATGQIDIAASIPGTYTVTNTIAAAGGCDEVSAGSPFEIISSLTWTGAVSADWEGAGNWSCGMVPGTALSVLIPDVANKPVISAGQTGSVKDLTIENGSSLTIDEGTLNISGSVANSGTLTATAGDVVFTGTTAQSIGTGTFNANTVRSLTVDNSAGVSLLGPLNVSGTVLVQSGSLASDGNLTLASDATQTALIDGSGNGQVTGNVTMQRHLTSGYGYRYFSSPFVAATVGEFGDDMDLAYLFPLIYRFDENSIYSGWIDYVNSSDLLNPLEGYAVNFGDIADPKTVDITGVVSNGNQNITLYNHDNEYTEGFNLIGNPYPSPIDWDGPGWTRTNIDDAVYYFRASTTDQYGGTYSSYAGGVSSDGVASNIIPSMQGFFVHVTDGTYPVTGSIAVTNSARTGDFSQPFLKSAVADNRFMIRAEASFTDDTLSADPLVILFDNAAEEEFDSRYDALKLFNTDMMVTNFYSVLPSEKLLSINALPYQNDTVFCVPLGLTLYRGGEVRFRVSAVNNMPADDEIYFRDAVTGANVNLLRNNEYKITMQQGEYNGRFTLAFVKSTTDVPGAADADQLFSAYLSGGVIKAIVSVVNGNEGKITVFDVSGRPVWSGKVYEPGIYDIAADVSQGICIISYMTGSLQRSVKLANVK